MSNVTCPSANTADTDQSDFWGPDGINWDAHRAGWVIAGVFTLLTVLLSIVTIVKHCLHYTVPLQQRQILRIVYMPPVYAILSFFSYRFFRSYPYYSLLKAVYEAITLAAFLNLIYAFFKVSLVESDAPPKRRRFPTPFCFWKFHPTKARFVHLLKWSVLQYVFIRLVLSLAGIIAQATGTLCETGPWSTRTAKGYIAVIDTVSVTIAMHGLPAFRDLFKEDLKGHRPGMKLFCIKAIISVTSYQTTIVGALDGTVIHGTKYWTSANITEGLVSLLTCIEMSLFALLMMYAYSWGEYAARGSTTGALWRPLWDSINYWDFVTEIWHSMQRISDSASTIGSDRKVRDDEKQESDEK